MESIIVTATDKKSVYEEILPQIEALISSEENLVANLANVVAVLKEVFDFFWVGFYLVGRGVDGGEELILAPFQGGLACTRIKFGKGVCGTAWKERRTLVVEDVESFPGHIACSSQSRSEIVVPMICDDGKVLGVIDIDSDKLSFFDNLDAHYLERVAKSICKTAK